MSKRDEVACRHSLTPWHLIGWLRQFREAALGAIAPPAFGDVNVFDHLRKGINDAKEMSTAHEVV